MGPFQRKVHHNQTTVVVDQRKDLCINERKRIYIHYFVEERQEGGTERASALESAMVYRAVNDHSGFFVRVVRITKFDSTIKRFLRRVLPFDSSQSDFLITLKSLIGSMPIKARNSTIRAAVELWKEANPDSSITGRGAISTHKVCTRLNDDARRRRRLRRKLQSG